MLYPAELRGPDRSHSRVSVWRNIVPQGRKVEPPLAAGAAPLRIEQGHYRQGDADIRSFQLSLSGGATGKGSGATGTPSSISAFASERLAWPWIGASSRSP